MKFPFFTKSGEKGFILVTVALGLAATFGVIGLVIDVGRVYVVKTELQRFADSAAAAASYELNGTVSGITSATSIAQNGFGSAAGRNGWDFGTKTVTSAQATFAAVVGGPYSASPSDASDVKFVQVSAAETVSYFFMPILPGISGSVSVTATSIAGQKQQTSLGDGLAPFSPDAHSATDPNFGFTRGSLYTLKWAPPGQRKKEGGTCSGDEGFTPGGGSNDRGFINVGQGNGNSGLVDVIVDNDYYLSSPMTVGSTIDMVSGNKSVDSAMTTRFNQDTDTAASDYAHYAGNGRRILVVPVNNNADPPLVAGFAAFFLQQNACGTKNNDPCCAEYVGAALAPSRKAASSSGGLYAVSLFR